MLKRGKIVALDSTQNLLNSITGCRVRLRLDAALPEALLPQLVEREAQDYLLALPTYQDLERVLAELRVSGVTVREMSLLQPDLEEVFLRVMGRSC
jgi:ABC-2 type transport system ATP-binding protein